MLNPDAPETQLFVVGLVGGIASGKSLVARLMESRGAVVMDADRLAHQVLDLPDVQAQIVERFGPKCLNPDRQIDRRMLGRVVFGDSEESHRARRDLEAIVHPVVRQKIQDRLDALRGLASARIVAVLDVPLLLEAGWQDLCDWIVFVRAPRDLRLARARDRGWSEAELSKREDSQWPEYLKLANSTHVLDNDSTESALQQQVDALWLQLEGVEG